MKKLFSHWEWLLLSVFILIAAGLRFASITKLQFFTYDQARDALFVKRIIVDHEFRLLGTQTSLPGMFLPPFYYYTLVPVLWLSGLNPVGIDIYSALIGTLTVPLIYFVSNKLFGRPAGIFSAGMMAVSPLLVELTRCAWNPNTLPFFILLAFFFLFRYYEKRQRKDFLLAYVFYGYCLSLHFGAWTLLPLFVFSWFFYLFKSRGKGLLGLLLSLGILIFFVSPLILFELKHNFFLLGQAKSFFIDSRRIGLNAMTLLEQVTTSVIALFVILISGKVSVGYGAPFGFEGKIKDLFLLPRPISVVAQKPFSISFGWWGILILALIVFFVVRQFSHKSENGKTKLALTMIVGWLFWGVLISRLYQGGLFFFYYLFLFPIPFLMVGFLGKSLWQGKLKIPALLVLFLALYFHIKFTTVFTPVWRNFSDLKTVALTIAENVSPDKSFNIATVQRDLDRWDRNSVDYRYFTETFGKRRALDWYPEDYQKAETLFVVDETGEADVLRSPIMEIQKFGPESIAHRWKLDSGIVIYQLEKSKL